MTALALRLARRDLRGGLAGFRVFLACLALGVAAIAAVGSLREAVRAGLRADARLVLGGDVDVSLQHRPASPGQRAYLAASGTLSAVAEMRAMARRADGGERILVELKAVDGRYPLYGAVGLDPAAPPLTAALGRRGGLPGAVADPAVLSRLGLALGDRIRLGEATFELRARLLREPDRGAASLVLGPRLMIATDALAATGLVQPGSIVQYHYRLRLPPGTDAAAWQAALDGRFPRAGWRLRGLDQAAPGLQHLIDRIGLYLTLIGLSALLIGGVGVANAVKSHLDGRTATIATLKCLGAPGRLIFAVYLSQIAALALAGVGLGLLLGAVAPFGLAALIGRWLPVAARVDLYAGPLLLATAYGLLTAFAFALWPLARAREVAPGRLFRALVAPSRRLPRPGYVLATAGLALALAALAVATTPDRGLALWFVAGAVAALAAFHGTGRLLARGARLAGRSRRLVGGRPALRLALANLHRPGTPMPVVVLSLGIGLTVLVVVGQVQGNLARQVTERMPKEAPTFYFIDIQPDQAAPFDRLLRDFGGARETGRLPHLRGRLVRIDGVPVDQARIAPEAAWITRSDRGITYAATPPPGTTLVAGKWWPADYRGPPLISFDAEAAAGLGVGVGDSLTLNVLGREVTGRIANLRRIDWGTLGLNFVFVFAPGTLEAAPQTYIATARTTPAAEEPLERAVTDRFANVSAIRVRQALEMVAGILGRIGAAVRATAGVSLLAGVLVLAGAVAAGHRRRVYDAVVLKVLGATRSDVLRAYVLEYGLLGLATAAVAAVLGSAAAWVVLERAMHTGWVFLPGTLALTAAACVAVVLAAGFIGTWRALGRRAAPLLRNE